MKYLVQAQNTLNLTNDELYIDLGSQLQTNSFIRLPKDQLHKNADNWLKTQLKTIQTSVCSSELVRSHVKGETVLLIAVVADMIAAKFNLNNPATCAALLVRIGITKVCSQHWQNEQ